ncbi:uncharacterized protein LACBIDRAFT_331696 [Laccaria bicolor S238N-H82]|uniref:Predicted protein n=1 Tax=Laccaria bicolor (strain S238N-H82 / ATCC MYA-4686) TaxID=486041 RepID=B0DQA0_LACBS|nr:uncharacterized protein LACBIDRAFT_331696 [Laccaria bicolor S238N-H82]EDR03347.1 predicted protein [Laccaria bicolor S238N-H82]|eukprot:XP_001886143.1 predicted protein [Laccaria bicolor S238N-H82]
MAPKISGVRLALCKQPHLAQVGIIITSIQGGAGPGIPYRDPPCILIKFSYANKVCEKRWFHLKVWNMCKHPGIVPAQLVQNVGRALTNDVILLYIDTFLITLVIGGGLASSAPASSLERLFAQSKAELRNFGEVSRVLHQTMAGC